MLITQSVSGLSLPRSDVFFLQSICVHSEDIFCDQKHLFGYNSLDIFQFCSN